MGSETELPTPTEIIEIHKEIERENGLTHTGSRRRFPKQTLAGILAEIDEHDGVYLRAGALLKRLISTHLFEDGNKRTAWTVTRLYLDDNGTEPAVRDSDHVAPILRRIQRFDADELAEWLETGEIDEERLDP